MPRDKYLRLGELLISEGLITPSQLEKAISVQRQESGRLGEVLIKLEMIKEDQIVAALGKQLNVPFFTLGTGMLKPVVDQGLEHLILQEFAFKNNVLPLSRTLRSLTVAMFDPLDFILIDNLKKLTGCEINPVIAARSDIKKAIEEFYGKSAMLRDAVESSYDINTEILDVGDDLGQELSLDKLIARAEEAPVIKMVDLIIRQAIEEGASDIHIEPFKEKTSLRYRIDGKLCEIPPPAKHLHLPLVSRIKILAKMDIAEKRLPQDGGILVRINDRPIDIRISTIPTIYGEKVVMRILDRGNKVLDLNSIGFDAKQLEQLRKAINQPYGLVFITGPTGSGKSTTLYAILNEIKTPMKNIVTVEDPVEYKIDGINQVQVKPEVGLTFAAALRSFLRQDPDIMMVGEVRDLETAQICMRSAFTGHLVLTTLHTNDAPSAPSRLMDIGVEQYMLAPSLLVVVAQRLIRKLCLECKEAYEPTAEQLKGANIKADLIYRHKGCSKCNNTGYRGRTNICEVMPCTVEIQNLINQRATYQKIRETARAAGMLTLYESGIKKIESGITSLEEIFSITLGSE